MPSVYIVADPTSRRFKFGITDRHDSSRVDSYRTALASFDRLEFPCSNPRDVEAALKNALAPHILPHASGAASEVADKGDDDAVLKKAIAIVLLARAPLRPDTDIASTLSPQAHKPLKPHTRASGFASLLARLVAHAAERGLRKARGVVFSPIHGSPCAFAPIASYQDHVSRVFGDGDPDYVATLDANSTLCRYISTNRHITGFPELAPDNTLLSFANGVLQLPDSRFTPHDQIVDGHPLLGRAARHHVDKPWTGATHTPALDALLDRQGIDHDTRPFLLALLGRSLLPAGSLDRWGVVPALAGPGSRDRSLLIGALLALFDRDRVARSLLGRLHPPPADTDLVLAPALELCPDLAARTTLRKRKLPHPVDAGIAPSPSVVAVADSIPASLLRGHGDGGDDADRLVVPILFERDTPACPRHEDDLARELPDIAFRMLASYKELRERVAEAGGGLLDHLPEQVRRWRGQDRAGPSSSKLLEFLAMAPEDRVVTVDGVQRRVTIERREGHLTMHKDFAGIFDAWTGTKGSFENEPAVFARFGFNSPNIISVCKGCGKRASAGCCSAYSKKHRVNKKAAEHMVLIVRP